LYEDEGTNYNYEKGEYSTIPFNWNNDKQQLTIGKRACGFEGMEQEKTFIVHLGKETKTIRYTGKKVNIKF
jgi:alpha-D-xyloside xylohydrolase